MSNDANENQGDGQKKKTLPSWAEHKTAIVASLIGALGTIMAALVAGAMTSEGGNPIGVFSDDYELNYSFYNVVLDGFKPIMDKDIDGDEASVVTVTRIDSILKTNKRTVDYSVPYYTTGKRIELETLKSSVKTDFKELENKNEKYRHHYEMVLPIGSKLKAHSEIIRNKFKFINGFRNGNKERWSAYIKYPTKAIGVHIECPVTRPCTNVQVFRRKGESLPTEIMDNPASLSDDGRHILWMANAEKPETRIDFAWDWRSTEAAAP